MTEMPDDPTRRDGPAQITEADLPLLRDIIGVTLSMRAASMHLYGAIRFLNVDQNAAVNDLLEKYTEMDRNTHEWLSGMLDDYKRLSGEKSDE